jgi:hypothetical protein
MNLALQNCCWPTGRTEHSRSTWLTSLASSMLPVPFARFNSFSTFFVAVPKRVISATWGHEPSTSFHMHTSNPPNALQRKHTSRRTEARSSSQTGCSARPTRKSTRSRNRNCVVHTDTTKVAKNEVYSACLIEKHSHKPLTSTRVVQELPAIQQKREILEMRSRRSLSCTPGRHGQHPCHRSHTRPNATAKQRHVCSTTPYLVNAGPPSPNDLVQKQERSHQCIFRLAKSQSTPRQGYIGRHQILGRIHCYAAHATYHNTERPQTFCSEAIGGGPTNQKALEQNTPEMPASPLTRHAHFL